jgi:hypothetical protein
MSTYAEPAHDDPGAAPASGGIYPVATASGRFQAVHYTGANVQDVQDLARRCHVALDAAWADGAPLLLKMWDSLSASWRWARPGDWIVGVGGLSGVLVLDQGWFQLLFCQDVLDPADRLAVLADLVARMQDAVADLASTGGPPQTAPVPRHSAPDPLSAASLRRVPPPQSAAAAPDPPACGDVWTDASGGFWTISSVNPGRHWWSVMCTDGHGRTGNWTQVDQEAGPMTFHHRPEPSGRWSDAA